MVKISNITGETINFLFGINGEFNISGTLNTFANIKSDDDIEIANEIANLNVVPNVTVSGVTESRLNEVIGFSDSNNKITEINNNSNSLNYTGYTIGNISYIDYDNGLTEFSFTSTTENTQNPTTFLENENFVNEPSITNNIFINRGVNSIFEPMHKLKISKSIEELSKVGFGYFNINKQG